MTPPKSAGGRSRTPLTRAPPSSVALNKVQRSCHTGPATSTSFTHDVFGTRLESPFQQQFDGEVVCFDVPSFDDEADLDGFRLAQSPDPFKIGSREEIRASMEMDTPLSL